MKTAISFDRVSKAYRLDNSPVRVLGDLIFRRQPNERDLSDPAKYFRALRDITFSVPIGERVGLIGRNGAGKTSLLKLITGNFKPSTGTVHVDGQVQALMQAGLGFHPEFTGIQNIRASLIYNGLDHAKAEAAAEDIIDFCELGAFIDRPLRTYSLGMQGRLQFAVATAVEPDILVIDEVLGSGDSYFAAKSAERLERLAFSGCTLVVVSHDMSQILKFCSRALWIDQGLIVMDASPQEIVNAYEVFTQNLMTASISGQRQTPSEVNGSMWLIKQIEKKEIGDTVDLPAGTAASALKQTLEDGQEVYRWPGKDGVKFASITVDADGTGSVVTRGGRLSLTYVIRADDTFTGAIRVYASIFGQDGERKAWLTSNPIELNLGKAGRVQVTCTLESVLLGSGEYLLSTSIFTDTPPENIGKAQRYDLVSRCIQLKVVDFDQRPPAVFHHPATWNVEAEESEHVSMAK